MSKRKIIYKSAIVSILLFTIRLVSTPAIAQEKPDQILTIKVVDSLTNIPIENVNISMAMSTKGGLTGPKGTFRIQYLLNSQDKITFTHIGYVTKTLSPEYFQQSREVIIPLISKVNEIKEIVVLNTGYQKISRERTTGSFTFLNNQELNLQVGSDVLQRLRGIANSIQFDESTNRPPITVRGLSTINGPKDPLIVVDDFPYEGDISNLNPNDIENVTILKDAAAASIWGTRAGNGVIVITTKKGKAQTLPTIGYNTNFTNIAKPDIFHYGQISPKDYIDIERQLFENGFYDNREASTNKLALSPVVEYLILNRDNQLSNEELNERLQSLSIRDVRDDFNNLIYQKGFNQQYALNIRGGSQRNTYYISGGHDKNVTVLDGKYSRNNLRASNSFSPINDMEVTTGIFYTQSKDLSGRHGYTGISNQINSRTIYPYTDLRQALDIYRKHFTETFGDGKLMDWLYYPLTESQHSTKTASLNHIQANVGINYRLFKGFASSIKYQYEKQQGQSTDLYDKDSFFARDLVNKFTVINQTTGALNYGVPQGSVIDNQHRNVVSSNIRAQLNYDYQDERSQLYILAGGEAREIKNYSNGNRTYGYNPELLTHGKVDLVNSHINNVTDSREFLPDGTSFSDRTNRYTSLFFNTSYTYKNKYTITGSVRKDASNLFGVRSNEKGIPLWSIGGKWDLYKEDFFDLSWVNLLSLRSSYGHSGNVDQNRSALTTITYLGGGATFTNFPQAGVTQYPNPDLRWEKVSTLNIGIDLSLFGNRMKGSIEYYKKTGTDLFGEAANDYTNGIGTLIKNVANMRGKGMDVNLNTNWIRGQFNWTTGLNLSYNTDKVTTYHHNTRLGSFYVTNGELISAIEGTPVYSILSYPFAGLSPIDGSPMGFLEGVPSTSYVDIMAKLQVEDLAFGGNALPPYFGNILNSFSYKEFTFNINLSYKLGHSFRRTSIDYNGLFNFGRSHSDFYDRWMVPGDELRTEVPSMDLDATSQRSGFYSNSTALVESANHVRIQFINLSYKLPLSIKRGNRRGEVELFTNCSNLGLLWKENKYGIDPDFRSIPSQRNYSLGIRAKL